MTDVVAAALDYLQRTYATKTVLLYGSFSTGTATETSDLDFIVFADLEEKCHDSTRLGGHILDAWIYPASLPYSVADFVHVVPFVVLQDDLDRGASLLSDIGAERARRTQPLSPGESAQLRGWIAKMLVRARLTNAEANYRYHWLLTDLPELYCQFRAHYYDGPAKTLSRLEKHDRVVFDEYQRLLAGAKDCDSLEALYGRVTAPEATT